jgi:hypothetical protein
VAPSAYLERLQDGWEGSPPIDPARLNQHVASHLIEPDLLRTDDFDGFTAARREALLQLIEKATDKKVYRGQGANEAEEFTVEAEPRLAELESV